MGQEGLDFRGEEDLIREEGVVERLDADPISRQEELASLRVAEGDGEHAVQPLKKSAPHLLIKM